MIIRIAQDCGMTVIELVHADGAVDPVTAIETAEAGHPRLHAPASPRRRWLRYTGAAGLFAVALVIGMALGGFHATPVVGTPAQLAAPNAAYEVRQGAQPGLVPSALPAASAAIVTPPVRGQGVPPRIAAALSSRPTVSGPAASLGSPTGATPDPEKLFGLQP
jgi:hypothetical protein